MYYATRQYAFEARHQLGLYDLSKDDNLWLYGSEISPHGHNYILRTEIAGSLHPKSSMILDLGDLDTTVNQVLVDKWDHDSLNEFVALPTHENLTLKAWDILRNKISLLRQIRLYESPSFWSDYFGNKESILYITQSYNFSASRRLFNPDFSEEQNLEYYYLKSNSHGHNFKLEITLQGSPRSKTGIMVRRDLINEIVYNFLEEYFDYRDLNITIKNANSNKYKIPSSESILRYMWELLIPYFADKNKDFIYDPDIDHKDNMIRQNNYLPNCTLYKIRLYETDEEYYDYYGD